MKNLKGIRVFQLYFLCSIVATLVITLCTEPISKLISNDLIIYISALNSFTNLLRSSSNLHDRILIIYYLYTRMGFYYLPHFFVIFNENSISIYEQLLYPLFIYENVSTFGIFYPLSLIEYQRCNFDVYVMFFSVVLVKIELYYRIAHIKRNKFYYFVFVFCLFFISVKPQCLVIICFNYIFYILKQKSVIKENNKGRWFIYQLIFQFLLVFLFYPLYVLLSQDFPLNFVDIIYRFYSSGNVVFMMFWLFYLARNAFPEP